MDHNPAQSTSNEIAAFSELIKGVVEPFTESQKVVAIETTKQTEITSKSRTKMFYGVCVLVTLIIVLAGIALLRGKDQITEKIIIAIVSFLGGIGFGTKQAISKNL